MRDDIVDVTIGGLLHDVGKVKYRTGARETHSKLGRDFLAGIGKFNRDILDCAAYHHAKELKSAGIASDSPAYIVYIADNISSGADRRDSASEGDGAGFDASMPLGSVFNLLNGGDRSAAYRARMLDHESGINYPEEGAPAYSQQFYSGVARTMEDALKRMEPTGRYLNSMSDLLEACLTYVPSSTSKAEQPDISLYDHSKTTAAIACCIREYLDERGISDFKTALFDNAQRFYDEKCFLMFSCDISGIQDFIYTVSGEKMLKSLRARSFYLEIMLEHIADEILSRVGLSRANLIYTGGGHAYMLLPNTAAVKRAADEAERELNAWYMANFKTALYIASAWAECGGNDLMNKPDGQHSYSKIFERLSSGLSAKKLARYDAEAIRKLNFTKTTQEPSGRECKECKRADSLTKDDICTVCDALRRISTELLGEKFFVVRNEPGEKSLTLPWNRYLHVMDEAGLRSAQAKAPDSIVRFYCKNKPHAGLDMATNLWMGDYASGDTFEELAEKAGGIDRIAVLRADVDNLGRAFVSGFDHVKYGERYLSLSRTSTLSRQLSLFFKYHVNYILKNPVFHLRQDDAAKRDGPRNAVVVYSGGDDMFIVGSWDDCVELAMDIRDAFREYTLGMLTVSAGIGIYSHSYPIARMAGETGSLEDAAKNADADKNKISLFDAENVFLWETLKKSVINEKLRDTEWFFAGNDERGKAMIYRLLGYMRGLDGDGKHKGDRINLARLAYLLARLEPSENDKKPAYSEFMRKFYGWALDKESRRELETALELYVYLERRGHGDD